MAKETELVRIDMRGQVCPSTLLTALREINTRREELARGEIALLFLTDNRAATHTIPDSAGNMGYEVTVDKEQGYYLIRVGRKQDDASF